MNMTNDQLKAVYQVLSGYLGGVLSSYLGKYPEDAAHIVREVMPWVPRFCAHFGVAEPEPVDHVGLDRNVVTTFFRERLGECMNPPSEQHAASAKALWEQFRFLVQAEGITPGGQKMLIRGVSDFSPYTQVREIANRQGWTVEFVLHEAGKHAQRRASEGVPDVRVNDDLSEMWLLKDEALAVERWYGEHEEPFKVVPEVPVSDEIVEIVTSPFTRRGRWYRAAEAPGCSRRRGPVVLAYVGTKTARVRVYSTLDLNGQRVRINGQLFDQGTFQRRRSAWQAKVPWDQGLLVTNSSNQE